MKYLPFDLEVALDHPERVITREGKKVVDILFMASSKIYPLVYTTSDGDIKTVRKNGEAKLFVTPHFDDLFLLPEYKERFVNVYYDPACGLQVGGVFDTLEQAKTYSYQTCYLKTIKITSLPYEPQHNNQ
jgi:hypothetical protein